MPIFLDCCTGEVEIVIPPPPPPVPPNCCTACPTLTVTPSIIDVNTWENTIDVSAVCLDGLTYTLQRSTSNAPNAVWMPMGAWTGSTIIDTGLPRTQASYWYRIVVSGQGTVGCFLNCANPSLAQATVPVCCVYSMTINNGQPVIIPLGDTSVSFNVTFTNTGGANCVADTPPALLLALTLSQVGALATVGAGSGNNNLYTYPVTITNIDTRNTLLVGFSAVVPCSGQVLSRTDFPISGTPSCCNGQAIAAGMQLSTYNTPNRLYPANTAVASSFPFVPGRIAIQSSALIERRFQAGVMIDTSITNYTNDSNGIKTTLDSIVVTPVPGFENLYDFTINLAPFTNCGGNEFDLRFVEYNGNTFNIDGYAGNPGNIGGQQNSENKNLYHFFAVVNPEYQSFLTNLPSSATNAFFNHYPAQATSITPANRSRPVAVYSNNPLPAPHNTAVPHYALDNVVTASKPYIVSMTSVGGSVNPSIGRFEIPSNAPMVINLRMYFPIQPGQGFSPHLRGGYPEGSNNTSGTPYFVDGWDRIFALEFRRPTTSSTVCGDIGVCHFRLNHCNQKVRGTITGNTPVHNIAVNAKVVHNGGGKDSLTYLGLTLSNEMRPYRTSTREFSTANATHPQGAAALFSLNRHIVGSWKDGNNYFYNNNWMYDANPTTTTAGVNGGISDVFTHREAFRMPTVVPFRISEYSSGIVTNRTGNICMPRYTHLCGYELAKVVEENFTTIFPATNVGFFAGATGSNNGSLLAGTHGAGTFDIDMNINPIVRYLSERLSIDFNPCCGFNPTSFKLTMLFYMESGYLAGFQSLSPNEATDNTYNSRWGTGNLLLSGRGGTNAMFSDMELSINSNTLKYKFVTAPTAFVVELDLDLTNLANPINAITYRNTQLISTHGNSGNAISYDLCSSAGFGHIGANDYRNSAWRTNPFDIDVTFSGTVINFTNSSNIDIISHANLPNGFLALRQAGNQSDFTNYTRRFLCPNLLLTTLNLCPAAFSGATALDREKNCNCDYSGTVYNGITAAPNGSEAHIINPNLRGEVVSRIAARVKDDRSAWGDSTGITQGVSLWADAKHFSGGFANAGMGESWAPISGSNEARSYFERKATLTSPYCNITTPSIALSVLGHKVTPGTNPGRADFML